MGSNRSNKQLRNVYYERIANKLNDPTTSSKTYWAIVKTIVNSKKVPVLPPILVNNKVVTNFEGKENSFNYLFSKQF